MVIRHQIEIPDKNPFENCKLGRKKYANTLTSIATTYAKGFVLALNNKWGDGKTTFVKMWRQSLKNQEYATLYFNAWENDFNHNPMVAILSELKTLDINDGPTTKTLINKGAQLSISLLPIVVSAIADKYINTEKISDAVQKLSEKTTDLINEQINEYASKKKGIEDFQKELEKYIQKLGKKPLIFIIDELDRCNPKYAVEVLEHIKHFFSVPGIVFVLSMDKEQLGQCIKGYFGSHEMDSDEYLRRFIDLEFSLPRPEAENYCNYLYDYYGFEDFFNHEGRRKNNELQNDPENFLNMAMYLFQNSSLSLRQQEKIFILTRIVLKGYNTVSYLFPRALLILIYLKTIKYSVYEKIRNKEFDIQQFIDVIYNALPKGNNYINEHFNQMIYAEAELALRYQETLKSKYNYYPEIIDKKKNPHHLLIEPRFDNSVDKRSFMDAYLFHARNPRSASIGLDNIIRKIDLIEFAMPG